MKTFDKDKIDEIVRRIVEAAHPDKILLFGSRARLANATRGDLDLAVIVSGDIHRRKTAQKIYMSLIGIGMPVDIIVLKPEDLEKHKNSAGVIVPTILKEGRELYVA